ncbi:(2Fe-2S)-binding protein [Paenibacillus whitsoniae]|uniref:(2Fe-2S)-binding protein n=1 Tax=Paenibacillus whitsoniae TaxID=2496558 RepID=A0A430JE91_9BACL|nr:(2Fe-2S)-binding protein [Paenibacillus whitsoniae]RTE09369.1 (2Fe-2S)-binding protein [Paenibacillus whitsoniae]
MKTEMIELLARHFGITPEPHEAPLYEIEGRRLVRADGMKEAIAAYAPLMKALEPAAAAAYLTGRLGNLNTAVHYMLAHDARIDLSPERWTLQIYQHERGYAEFRYVLSEIVELEGPLSGQRSLWREQQLRHWYGNVMRPIVEVIAAAADMDITQLWRLFPMKFPYFHEALQKMPDHESIAQKFGEDYKFALHELDGEPFGRVRNPLDVTFCTVDYPAAPGQPDEQIRMKTSCCMYHRTEGGYYCYTCPRLKPEERAKRKEEMRAKLEEQALKTAAAQ